MKAPEYYPVSPKDIKPGDRFIGYNLKAEKGTHYCMCTVIVNDDGIPLLWGKNTIKEEKEIIFFRRELTFEEIDEWHKTHIDLDKEINKLNLSGFHNNMYDIGDATHEMWNGWLTAGVWAEQLNALENLDFFVVGIAPAPIIPDYFKNAVAVVIEEFDTGNRYWCHWEMDYIEKFRRDTKHLMEKMYEGI